MPELRMFDPETATENDFIKRLEFHNLETQEASPDDPPNTLERSVTTAKNWKLAESITIEVWQLCLDDAVIAELMLNFDSSKEENTHLFDFQLHVLQPYRMKGYSKLLLPKLVNFANKYNCRLGQSYTTSRIAAGQEFAEHLNANKGLDESVGQLVLDKLDVSLIQNWLDEAKIAKQNFEIGFWGNVYPEEDIQKIAELFDVMNTAPKENLDKEDSKTKPERLRENEALLNAQSDERKVLYIRHKESGELVGFTETYWEAETPEVLYQCSTGVLPQFRGNKLGKWLKAAMIQKIIREKPNVKVIRTENATSNVPMLAINAALGFEPYESIVVWQIEVDKIRTYLK